MSENDTYTVFDTETQQPLTVTVAQGGADDSHGTIQYITQDGVQIQQITQPGGEIVQVRGKVQAEIIQLNVQSGGGLCVKRIINCSVSMKKTKTIVFNDYSHLFVLSMHLTILQ